MDLISRTFQVPHTSSLQALLGRCHPLRRSIQPTVGPLGLLQDIALTSDLIQRLSRETVYCFTMILDSHFPPAPSQAGVAGHSEGHRIKAFQMATALVR